MLSFTVRYSRCYTNTSWFEKQVTSKLNITLRLGKATSTKLCVYILETEDLIKINCDRASRGNLGASGYGFIAKNSDDVFPLVMEKGIGYTTNILSKWRA